MNYFMEPLNKMFYRRTLTQFCDTLCTIEALSVKWASVQRIFFYETDALLYNGEVIYR